VSCSAKRDKKAAKREGEAEAVGAHFRLKSGSFAWGRKKGSFSVSKEQALGGRREGG